MKVSLTVPVPSGKSFCERFSFESVLEVGCTACTGMVQFKGLGIPNKHFATQNRRLYRQTHCLRPLRSLLECFQNLKIIFSKTVRFQAQLEADGYFSAQKFLSWQTAASSVSWYQLTIFEFDFTNPISKTLVELRPNPIFRTKNCTGCASLRTLNK